MYDAIFSTFVQLWTWKQYFYKILKKGIILFTFYYALDHSAEFDLEKSSQDRNRTCAHKSRLET